MDYIFLVDEEENSLCKGVQSGTGIEKL